ncbi:MAG: hypothetical protein HQ592_01895 [Planctomycetes bacterium]|nr:hypothetical protein [Planctomycetota bacterium]
MVTRLEKKDGPLAAWAGLAALILVLSISLAPSGGCKAMEPPKDDVGQAAENNLAEDVENDTQPAPEPRHKGSRILQSNDLVVEVMEPNHPERYNRGIRFTPVAAVLRVAMNGDEFLTNPIEHNPVSDQAGLAAEFDLVTPNGPPGYVDAKEGEGFVKVGVGVLKKKGQPYGFWNQYEPIDLAATTVKWGKAKAEFHQVSKGANGYAYELWATVDVKGKQVIVDWKLANTGTKPFETHHYAHNFFAFGDLPVGPDYVLSFPYDYKAGGLAKEQKQVGRDIQFIDEIPKAVNMEVQYPRQYKGANELTVKHTKSGHSIHCVTSVAGIRTAIHAHKRALCPEQFVALALEPGEKTQWIRTYTFGRKAD